MKTNRVSVTLGLRRVTQLRWQQPNGFSGSLLTPAKPRWLLIAAAVLLALGSAPAATNDPAMALQKGLFEEEANHDLNAAIRAYRTVIKQFDQDRKLAATAVFRLGECYRKQGNTNDANAQYERVIRDFPDQTPLVTLSRSYLGAAESGSAAAQAPEAVRRDLATAAVPKSEQADEVRRIQRMIKDSPDLINARNNSGQTPLHRAAEQGQLTVATFLLDNGAEVDPKDKKGQTPLHLAASSGATDMVELLLAHKADVRAKRYESTTPTALHIAVEKGLRTLVELLLAHKADVNARGGSGPEPLHIAAIRGFKVVADVLIRNGADVNAVASPFSFPPLNDTGGTPLHIAAQRGDVALAELLLANKGDPNAVAEGQTPLLKAAEGSEPVVKVLLAHGAEVNAHTKTGWTPLLSAVLHQNLAAARVLVAAHADPNIPFQLNPGQERTPLYVAVSNQNPDPELVRILLESGANPNITDEQMHDTPLIVAARLLNKEMVSLLLAANANPNAPDGAGETALHLSLADPAIAGLLLSAKADANAREQNGETPLHWAAGAGLKSAAALLVEHGAELNARDNLGNTPLHFAVLAGRTELVDFLLAKGADPNIANQDGKTPLDWSKVGLGYPSAVYWVQGPANTSFPRPSRPQQNRVPRMPGQPMPIGAVPQGGSVNPSSEAREEIAAALKSHGAVQDLPHLDRIEVTRSGNGYTVFRKGTNDWNRFTLLEALAVDYELLSGNPEGDPQQTAAKQAWAERHLGFPDFTSLRIRRPEADLKTWHERKVDLSAVLSSGDCSKDVPLNWGEVIEVPEADHPLNERWQGFAGDELAQLRDCLTRQIEVVIKGRATKIKVGPKTEFADLKTEPEFQQRNIVLRAPVWLKPALRESNLLLASSDLSRIKVTRRESATGEKHEWVLDCSDGKPAPAFWLRDGDVIEVPEKP